MTSWRRTTFLVTATLTTLAACSTDTVVSSNRDLNVRATSLPSTPGQYVIIGRGETLPANLEAEVAAAGGTIVQSIVEIGVAVAKSNDASFRGKASKITGVESVTPDLVMEWTEPLRTEDMTAEESALVGEEVASSADNDPLYRYQWAPPAIQAPETWNAGLRGTGVRVAILDGGLFSAHPDLAANVDVAASRSFVAGFNFNQDIGTFWHGTHVAGIVAAVDNTIGVVGIAPKATLIGVKVLHGSSGSFTAVINGIMYAATPLASGGGGADVINMSLGATITDAKNKEDKADIKELTKAIDRATKYANQQGVVVVAAAGNSALDHDVNDVLTIPAQAQSVISVSATAPEGWALGATNFSKPASYTNYGKRLVTFGAPGGDFDFLPSNRLCTLTGNTRPCWVFDMYLSTSRGSTANGGYSWAAGTSMASPVVAGIAALIIQSAGGDISPAAVKARIQSGAADLGKPGNDEFYGHGWVNAYRSAVQ